MSPKEIAIVLGDLRLLPCARTEVPHSRERMPVPAGKPFLDRACIGSGVYTREVFYQYLPRDGRSRPEQDPTELLGAFLLDARQNAAVYPHLNRAVIGLPIDVVAHSATMKL